MYPCCLRGVIMSSKDEVKFVRVNISVPEPLLEDFKAYCERQVRPLSSQIQYMMKKALEDEAREESDATH